MDLSNCMQGMQFEFLTVEEGVALFNEAPLA